VRYNKDVIPLLEVPVGKYARLVDASSALRKRLAQYGLHLDDRLHVLRVAPMGGPLLVEVNGREIALGRAVAEKILVEVE
jgi:ferrous iron transport protein A